MLFRVFLGLLLFFGGNGLQAQLNLHVTGSPQFYIAPGAIVHVAGGGSWNVGTGAKLENRGTLTSTAGADIDGQLVGTEGRFQFSGSGAQFLRMNNGQDTMGTLHVQMTSAGELKILNNHLAIEDSLSLIQGRCSTQNISALVLLPDCHVTGGSTGTNDQYIDGPVRLVFPYFGSFRDKSLPLVNTSTGTDKIRSTYIYNYLGVDDGGNYDIPYVVQYWLRNGPLTPGTLGAGVRKLNSTYELQSELVSGPPNINGNSWAATHDIALPYINPPDSASTMVADIAHLSVARSLNLISPFEIDYSVKVPGSGTLASGQAATSSPGPVRDLFLEPNKVGNTYHYRIASCGATAGATAPLNALQCEGDTNALLTVAYTGDVTWQESPTGLPGTWVTVAGPNAPPTYNTGILNGDLYFRAVYELNSCAPDSSAPVFIDVRPKVKSKLKVVLQGPYNAGGDTMRAEMSKPASPFAKLDTVYTATGSAPVRMFPGYPIPAGAVDVVIVELRDATTPIVVIDTALAWLMSDGTLRDFFTGTTNYIGWCDTGAGNFHIVVKHRNHLGLMTRNPQALNTSIPGSPFDMTLPANVQVNGGVNVGNGRVGAIAGNCDNSAFARGQINVLDFYYVYLKQVTTPSEYAPEDVNLDGVINADDFTLVSKNNDELYNSQVPGEQ